MEKADLILKSGAIFRGVDAPASGGFVAIRGERIRYVGDSAALLEGLTGPDTRVLDFGDRLIMPGFHDAHLHFYLSSLYSSPLVAVSLDDTGEEQCVSRLAPIARRTPRENWLIGAGWRHSLWKQGALPTKRSLDAAYPDRPVAMLSGDCHTLWLNSRGLERLGLAPDSRETQGGGFERFPDGELTGVVHEAAATALCRRVFAFSPGQEDGVYLDFIRKLNENGITAVCDMSLMAAPGADFIREDIYERLLAAGKLTVRVSMFPTLRMDLSRPREMMERYTGNVLRCQGVKQFMDGVSSCHTAYLKEDYADAAFPGDRGALTVPADEMREMILNAHKNDISTRVHTIGDQAIHLMLDFHRQAVERYGRKPWLQHTLEHLENFQPEDIARLGALGVLPSVQPSHMLLNEAADLRYLGARRKKDMWPLRRLLDAGGALAFGTDSPVVDVNPFLGLYHAVTRRSVRTHLPEGGRERGERLTMAQALEAYTRGSARAANRAGDLGVLAPGMLADVVVLDRDLLRCDVEDVPGAKVLLTVMGGQVVWEA